MLSDLDPLGRMARVVVEVMDPLELGRPPSERRLPLLVGAFVSVRLVGTTLDDVVAVPREAIREGDSVWVATRDDTLEIRPVIITWRERTRVLVVRGLADAERIISSPLSAPVEGMALRFMAPMTAIAPSDRP